MFSKDFTLKNFGRNVIKEEKNYWLFFDTTTNKLKAFDFDTNDWFGEVDASINYLSFIENGDLVDGYIYYHVNNKSLNRIAFKDYTASYSTYNSTSFSSTGYSTISTKFTHVGDYVFVFYANTTSPYKPTIFSWNWKTGAYKGKYDYTGSLTNVYDNNALITRPRLNVSTGYYDFFYSYGQYGCYFSVDLKSDGTVSWIEKYEFNALSGYSVWGFPKKTEIFGNYEDYFGSRRIATFKKNSSPGGFKNYGKSGSSVIQFGSTVSTGAGKVNELLSCTNDGTNFYTLHSEYISGYLSRELKFFKNGSEISGLNSISWGLEGKNENTIMVWKNGFLYIMNYNRFVKYNTSTNSVVINSITTKFPNISRFYGGHVLPF